MNSAILWQCFDSWMTVRKHLTCEGKRYTLKLKTMALISEDREHELRN